VSGGRVLVVDDTRFNRQLLVRLLTTIGHETVEAGDGREALALLRNPATAPVDVVLLDIVMPEMDGYETLAALKADEVLRDLPVIIISGVDELASVVRCIQMGATDYLPKTGPASKHRWHKSACVTSSSRPVRNNRPSTRSCGS